MRDGQAEWMQKMCAGRGLHARMPVNDCVAKIWLYASCAAGGNDCFKFFYCTSWRISGASSIILASEAGAPLYAGIVIAFVIAELSVFAMIIGGVLSWYWGLLLTNIIAPATIIRKDASLASLYFDSAGFGDIYTFH